MLNVHARNRCPHLPLWAYTCLKKTDTDVAEGDDLYVEILDLVDNHLVGFTERDWLRLESHLLNELGAGVDDLKKRIEEHPLPDFWWLVESTVIEHITHP